MNIVYFGTDVFLSVFEYLNKNHNILALYTYHNDEDYFTERGIVQLAHMSDIPVHHEKIDLQSIERYIQEEQCDLFFVAEYSSLLPVPKDEPRFRAVNIHSSLLPEGRSYYPIEVAMARGMTSTGVTMHKISPELDHGDIIIQMSYDIHPGDDSIDIYLKSRQAGKAMVETAMNDFEHYWLNAVPQIKQLPYWKRPPERAMTITHDMTVEQARRIYASYNKMTKVCIDSLPYYIDSFMTGRTPIGDTDGDIIIISDRRIIYGLTDGNIRLDICPVGVRE